MGYFVVAPASIHGLSQLVRTPLPSSICGTNSAFSV